MHMIRLVVSVIPTLQYCVGSHPALLPVLSRRFSWSRKYIFHSIISDTFPIINRRISTGNTIQCHVHSKLVKSQRNFSRSSDAQQDGDLHLFLGPVPREALTVTFSRSGGAGGQHVNKVSTKVDVRFHVLSADWLSQEAKETILSKLASRINKNGELVVQCQDTRSQQRNYELAVQRITAMLIEATKKQKQPSIDQRRKVETLKREFNARRLEAKKKNSKRKADRKRIEE